MNDKFLNKYRTCNILFRSSRCYRSRSIKLISTNLLRQFYELMK